MSSNAPTETPKYIKFLFGGSAGMLATLFVQPLDLVKNRMQMSGEGSGQKLYKNSMDALVKITKNEGLSAVYNGLSAGLFRQATYTTTRLGIFTALNERYASSKESGGKPPGFLQKLSFGLVAGMTGSFVGTPAELSLIRMTSDGRLPVEQRRNYRHVFDALARVVREEGVTTLWRGCLPTMARAGVVNMAQLVSYSQAKQYLVASDLMREGISMHFCASMFSGLVTTVASMPVDIVKTRIQNMRIIDGQPEYRNGIDCFRRIVAQEGVLSLWKGFTPYYLRIGPHTVLTFIFIEQMYRLYRVHVLRDESGSRGSGL